MIIRHLRIKVSTSDGIYSSDIPFTKGLNVVWADNSMGKSTCVKSIIIALGLEAMLTVNRAELPVPPALLTELETDTGLVNVLESDIFLEIENDLNSIIVLHRTIKGNRDKDLITVICGPALTTTKTVYESKDYFLTRDGSATRKLGFHTFLAEFLGLSLPEVFTYEGVIRPLYLQYIFPYAIVEQTRGWASLDPPVPTQFRIREPHRRAVEFLLDFDAIDIAALRVEIENEERKIISEWNNIVTKIVAIAKTSGGVVNRLPQKPTTSWPLELPPTFQVPKDDKWIFIENFIQELSEELSGIINQEIPTVNQITNEASEDLKNSISLLKDKESLYSRLVETLSLENGELSAVSNRINQLIIDLKHNKDIKTIMELGSTLLSISAHKCPTCHQDMKDTLMPTDDTQRVMSIADNINYLKEQVDTYNVVKNNLENIVGARAKQIDAITSEIRDIRKKIRYLKETLTSDGRMLSASVIERKISITEKIKYFAEVNDNINFELRAFYELSKSWNALLNKKSKLPKTNLSSDDFYKIGRLSALIREQLIQYDFQSLDELKIDEISISNETYKPAHFGLDLPSSISASDFIRLIWAYLNGMLELAREIDTNHFGFIIFDEPKQQSAKQISFRQLLMRTSTSSDYHQQVIFFTSEDREVLAKLTSDIKHNLIPFDGRMIAKH